MLILLNERASYGGQETIGYSNVHVNAIEFTGLCREERAEGVADVHASGLHLVTHRLRVRF